MKRFIWFLFVLLPLMPVLVLGFLWGAVKIQFKVGFDFYCDFVLWSASKRGREAEKK